MWVLMMGFYNLPFLFSMDWIST